VRETVLIQKRNFFYSARNRPDTASLYKRRDSPTKEIAMTAIAKVFSNTIPAISRDLDILRTVAVFCGVGLFVSLLAASYGLDLSAGFF
jgi:hypothetical protein